MTATQAPAPLTDDEIVAVLGSLVLDFDRDLAAQHMAALRWATELRIGAATLQLALDGRVGLVVRADGAVLVRFPPAAQPPPDAPG